MTAVGWRILVRHTTEFRYESAVTDSYNEVRMTPMATDRQHVLEASLVVRPAAHVSTYVDYWGTRVHAFDLHRSHESLEVRATSLVETASPPPRAPGASWADLEAPSTCDRWCEELGPSRHAPDDDGLAAVAAGLRDGRTPREAVDAAVSWVRGAMTYAPGSTAVTTTAAEAVRARKGVCQDFSHVTISLLRAMGVPARYASGYLHPSPDAAIGEAVIGESHAWVEAWVGEWVGIDPTNGVVAGDRHVLVGRGRDYADVAPLRGVYSGGRTVDTAVRVQLTRRA